MAKETGFTEEELDEIVIEQPNQLSRLNKMREYWSEKLLDWALQAAPKTTINGRKIRQMVAGYESLKT